MMQFFLLHACLCGWPLRIQTRVSTNAGRKCARRTTLVVSHGRQMCERLCKRHVVCHWFLQVLSGSGMSLAIPPYAFERPGILGDVQRLEAAAGSAQRVYLRVVS
jgi:hypothetical protein